MKKLLVLGLLFGTVVAWNAGCSGGDDDDDDHHEPDSVTVSGGTTVAVDATLQLTAMANFDNGDPSEDVTASSTWTTNSAAIATVSASGLVTGEAVGTATITATHDGVAGNATITVTATATTFDLIVNGSNWAHGGATQGTGIRILDSTDTEIYCQIFTNLSATWTRTATDELETGEDYTVEIFGDFAGGNNNSVFDDGEDHIYSFDIVNVDGNETVDMNHTTVGQAGAIGWTDGNGCPGS